MPSSTPTPFIACGCLIHDGGGRYLLVRETKTIARGRLSMPGGKVEPGESLHAAAIREVREETGLRVRLDSMLEVFHTPRTTEQSFGITFVFAASIIGGSITTSVEHPEIVWRTTSEIEDLLRTGGLRGRHTAEVIHTFESGQSLPLDLVTEVAPVPSPLGE